MTPIDKAGTKTYKWACKEQSGEGERAHRGLVGNGCVCLVPVIPYWPFGYWGNAEKDLRETPPSCSNLPTKSFPFSEKVFMPPSPWGKVASLIFRPGYGQYG